MIVKNLFLAQCWPLLFWTSSRYGLGDDSAGQKLFPSCSMDMGTLFCDEGEFSTVQHCKCERTTICLYIQGMHLR